MRPKTLMLIAGEPSGDWLAAELIKALREELCHEAPLPGTDLQPLRAALEPRFFGAGGRLMAAAGADLALDLTAHSVVGLSDVLRNYLKFRRFFRQLYRLALDRLPDAVICVDFSGFNRRFAHAIKQHVRREQVGWFQNWHPKLIQYVSPQVWASRQGRARQVAGDYDLLLSIFPFEKDWYAQRVPNLRVEFVGNPVVERHLHGHTFPFSSPKTLDPGPSVLLLPGSRRSELQRHLPVMLGALARIRAKEPETHARMVLPAPELVEQAKALGLPDDLPVQCAGLAEAMMESTVAIASTGTVTMECASYGLPTVAIYKTSWSTYQLAKRIVKVDHLAMPNLLAKEPVFPEFIQDAATPENIAAAAMELLRDPARRADLKKRLAALVQPLGTPGATRRAAQAICRLLASSELNSREPVP